MNPNTSGALLIAILAVAGFAWGSPVTVWSCMATCAAAFLAEEVRNAPEDALGIESFDTDAIAAVLALISWATVAVAIIVLLF